MATSLPSSPRVVEQGVPPVEFAWLDITPSCQLRCVHCDAGSRPGPGQMNVSDWKAVLAALWLAVLLFGAGFGSFLGVDILLAVRVLPSARERGKDLGIMYTAIFVPLIMTPLIGAFILNVFQENFAALFSVAVVASLLAALFLLPIRSVTETPLVSPDVPTTRESLPFSGSDSP